MMPATARFEEKARVVATYWAPFHSVDLCPRGATAVGVQYAAGASWRQARHPLRRSRSRLLRRLAVADQLGCRLDEVEIDMSCLYCGATDHGRPTLRAPDTGLFISSASTGTACAVAIAQAPVGIDLEARDRFAGISLRALRRALPAWNAIECALAPEGDLARLWTALEALTKGLGKGLVASYDEVAPVVARWSFTWHELQDGHVLCFATGPADE
jgi:phosphopantetheinyl transferase